MMPFFLPLGVVVSVLSFLHFFLVKGVKMQTDLSTLENVVLKTSLIFLE